MAVGTEVEDDSGESPNVVAAFSDPSRRKDDAGVSDFAPMAFSLRLPD